MTPTGVSGAEMTRTNMLVRLGVLVGVGAMFVAGCGDDSNSSSGNTTSTTSGAETTTTGGGSETTTTGSSGSSDVGSMADSTYTTGTAHA